MSGAVSALYRGWRWDKKSTTDSTYTAFLDGVEFARYEIGGHTRLNSVTDGKNVRINSRNVTQTSGDHSGVQIKPNQTVATASITGLEVSPRFASGIAGTNLVAIKADPVLKGTTGAIGGEVVGVQVNIDFGISGSRVMSDDISAFETFLAIPSSGMTYNGRVAVMRVRTVNIRAWDEFINFDDANTGAVVVGDDSMTTKNPEGDTESGYLKIRVAGTSYQIPIYVA